MDAIQIDINKNGGEWANTEEIVKTALLHAHKALTETSKFGIREPGIQISVLLSHNAFIQTLNKTYRQQDKPTNVLSFPQNETYHLGDIILAYETICDEATKQKKTFKDHLIHLVIHGLLHLLGYDHETEKEAQEMEALEIEILRGLDIKNPYEDETFNIE